MVFCLHVRMCPCACLVLRGSKEHTDSSGTGIVGGCELLCVCWEFTLGPLQEQSVLLSTD